MRLIESVSGEGSGRDGVMVFVSALSPQCGAPRGCAGDDIEKCLDSLSPKAITIYVEWSAQLMGGSV
jgi:hypothetical protein